MKIDHKLRILIKDQTVIQLVKAINRLIRDGYQNIEVCLEATNACLNEAYDNKALWSEDEASYQAGINACYNNNELIFLNALVDEGIITWINVGKDDFVIAGIKVKSVHLLFKLEDWILQLNEVIEYGDFCLNKLTGEAYCLGKAYQFVPLSGLYRLFEAFLFKHFLTHEEIIKTQQMEDELTELEESNLRDKSREHVNEIKKAFDMPRRGRYLRSAKGQGYLLSPYKSF